MYKSAKKLREEFNQVALRFERPSGGLKENRNFKARSIKKYLSNQLPTRGEFALEIGSGLGSFTARLAERFDHVTALDLSPEMVRVAQENVNEFKNIEFVITDVNVWEFPREHFDCIVSITTLHHMPLEPILIKIKDALKPGGILLVGDFYERQIVEKYVNKIFKMVKKSRRKLRKSNQRKNSNFIRGAMGHDANEKYLSIKEVRRICDSLLQGATVVKHSQSNAHFYSILWKKPELMSEK